MVVPIKRIEIIPFLPPFVNGIRWESGGERIDTGS
jgi:hypothetical protein